MGGAVDRELVERARNGDHDAFELLAAGIVDRLYGVARLVLRDADRAEDAAQEALVRCWRDLPALRETERFDAWLNRLLMNAITDEFRRGTRFRASVTVLNRDPTMPDAAAATADRDLLERGFARLSLEHRQIVVLRLHLGLSIEEAASTLGIPVGTAKSRLHYAVEALRLALEADAAPPRLEVSA
jgi:RNA polymerase sigma-70 factor (ECF subfamily)